MSDYITIQLSKQGKYKGLYETIIDQEDADLDSYRWSVVLSSKRVPYVGRIETPKRNMVWIHRIILARKLNLDFLPKGIQVDHVNGNGLDNRRDNLRLATVSQNAMNKKRQNNSSGIKGVSWYKQTKRWKASIMVNGKSTHIGYFKIKEDAAEAYRRKADELHKEYARYE